MFDQHVLARSVPRVLTAELGDRHVTLVDHHQEVIGEEIEQGVGRFARGPAVEVPRIVLDPRAHAGLGQHLEIVLGADPQSLRLEQLALALELLETFAQFDLDALDRALDDLVAGDVVGRCVNRNVLELFAHLARQHIEGHDALDGVAEHLDPQRLLFIGGMDFDRVPSGPKRATHQIHVVARVLQLDEPAQDFALVVLVTDPDAEDAVAVLVGGTESVNARDRRHHNDVLAHQERRGSGVAEPVDLVVD